MRACVSARERRAGGGGKTTLPGERDESLKPPGAAEEGERHIGEKMDSVYAAATGGDGRLTCCDASDFVCMVLLSPMVCKEGGRRGGRGERRRARARKKMLDSSPDATALEPCFPTSRLDAPRVLAPLPARKSKNKRRSSLRTKGVEPLP